MKKVIVTLLILAMLLGIGWIIYQKAGIPVKPAAQETEPSATAASTAEASTEPTMPMAPDFTVYDPEGNPVKLSSFVGKPVVLNFWASWCGPCKMEMPEFEEKHLELGREIAFLMINVTTNEKSQSDATELIGQLGYTFPVYYDLTGEAAGTYGISAFPTTFFISAKGEAVARAVGAIDGATLQKGIDMIR